MTNDLFKVGSLTYPIPWRALNQPPRPTRPPPPPPTQTWEPQTTTQPEFEEAPLTKRQLKRW